MRPKRLLTICAIAAPILLGCAAYIYLCLSRPIGFGPAGPRVTAADFAKKWSEAEVLLVGIGDSVTAGFGARHGYSYFDRLISNPPDESADIRGCCLTAVFPHLQYTNLAVSGSTSGEHLLRQVPALAQAGSNVMGIVVITTGGNDLIHNYGRTPPREEAMYGATWEQAKPWIHNFESRLNRMVEELRSRFPGGCQIFLANIFDPTDGVGNIQSAGLPSWPDGLKILAAYNEIIRKCCEGHPFVHLVDLHDAFLGHGLHCTQFWSPHYDRHDPHYWYYVNLEDPNERGYDAIRRLFLLKFRESANQFQ